MEGASCQVDTRLKTPGEERTEREHREDDRHREEVLLVVHQVVVHKFKLFLEAGAHKEVAELALNAYAERQEEAARDEDRGEKRHKHTKTEHESKALDERRAKPKMNFLCNYVFLV